jgi:hypothetical protein
LSWAYSCFMLGTLCTTSLEGPKCAWKDKKNQNSTSNMKKTIVT